jgi:signal transduction histidine kinase
MADSITKARRSLWPFGIVATGTLTYFLTLFLVLYVLDRQIYTTKKLEIIRDNFYRIFDLPDSLNQTAHGVLFNASPADRKSAERDLQHLMDAIVNSPSSMYRMELHDVSDAIVASADAHAKVSRFNTWRNSLFLRNFSGRTSQLVREGGQRGLLVGYYTSPVDYAPIEQLTSKYRLLAGLLVALWSAVYAYIYRKLLRPVRNVTAYLERSRDGAPQLILGSREHLESAYNKLATRALLQLIEERLSSPMRPSADGQPEDRSVAVASALTVMSDAFALRKLYAAEIALTGDEIVSHEIFSPGEMSTVSKEQLVAELTRLSPDGHVSRLPEEGSFLIEGDAFRYGTMLSGGSCLLLHGELDRSVHGFKQRVDGLERSCSVLRRGFLAYKAYREGIIRQRSEANIVLSRNLGHDLTNIIATSKLDLMAVRRLLDTPTSSNNPGIRAELLQESIRGLLDNTRFLQEIVNIYRSFSHVKRPQYERRDLRGLVEEFLNAFEPSVSSRIAIRRELDAPMPAPIVEPRLLKLALFNVLTNALDALRRNPPDDREPMVLVRTGYDEATRLYRVVIEDNGPGIRDETGRPLGPAELQAIFEYGYSTKSESNEGLGLSWVRTIMTDFHDGAVLAENVDQGGARFTLQLHSMERSEAKVGSASS